ncbi:hypothetical protein MINTM002_31590 [Mycobacterium intracellulare]|uniref:hypothetical protein n=1 Tax=Mycobacterium intracellulare TaxID=1767 RepID=UPI001929501F|nr:hypothetical protein [Mycobacterium intracellulare]BCO47485.1 hypothetical protein MINTM002_31590 [Mycobacterium intracellulare]
MFKLFRRINKDKIELIDRAFSTLRIQSFADLGGVWRVEGAYTFHALENYKIKSATLADLHLTAKVTDRAKLYPQLRLIQGNFGSEAVVEQIGGVDAILLFDVLLHQVLPDWDAVLESYANKVDTMLIYNQQWMGSDTTVRLLDLGEKEYLRNVPSGHDEYNGLFQKLDQKHPEHDRTWRDYQGLWQWGITDAALESKLADLGYKLVYKKDCGKFGRLPNFDNHAFLFTRR